MDAVSDSSRLPCFSSDIAGKLRLNAGTDSRIVAFFYLLSPSFSLTDKRRSQSQLQPQRVLSWWQALHHNNHTITPTHISPSVQV
jgi:hypothetical protein